MKPGAWRAILLASCAVLVLLVLADMLMFIGLGATPLVGQWGNTVGAASEPFELQVRAIDPGGPSDRVGIRSGDRIDVRANSALERFWLFGQPITGHPVTVVVRQGAAQHTATIVPREAPPFRRWMLAPIPLGTIWLLVFAGLIARRRSNVREMRLLCLVLVFYGLWEATNPRFFAAPWPWAYVVLAAGNVFGTLSVAFWAATAGCFAEPRSTLRRGVQVACYALLAVSMAVGLTRIFAITTLRIDPIAFSSMWSGAPFVLAFLAALTCAILAVAAATGAERQRALWSLVPAGLLIIVGYTAEALQAVVTSYELAYADYYVASLVDFVTPLALLYVALNRRLLDVGFVLNRAAVFAIVSSIVIGAFILVEWAASEWLVSASHTTSAVIGMGVALALGLSMRYIHRYVDRFTDRVFFRKRHEDEAALRHFAHEAAYITDRTTLLDRTLATVKRHTGNADASILVPEGLAAYARYASSNGAGGAIDENDPAIVALRAWHKPVDLEKFDDTALHGQFAFPMTSRGALVGVLVCGTKQDSEAYAPDEADALMTLAHGVGSALGVLSAERGGTDGSIAAELGRLREEIERNRELFLRELREAKRQAT